MNVLDENIPENQRLLLRAWGIRVRQIDQEVGRQGMKDEEIIPLLHQLGRVTFLTRDLGFYRGQLCHREYCLVCLAVEQYEAASFIRRLLRHPTFDTQAKRLGKVIHAGHIGVRVWQLETEQEQSLQWPA